MSKKKRYNVCMDEEIHDKGVKKAKKSGRSFSNWIEQLILKSK